MPVNNFGPFMKKDLNLAGILVPEYTDDLLGDAQTRETLLRGAQVVTDTSALPSHYPPSGFDNDLVRDAETVATLEQVFGVESTVKLPVATNAVTRRSALATAMLVKRGPARFLAVAALVDKYAGLFKAVPGWDESRDELIGHCVDFVELAVAEAI